MLLFDKTTEVNLTGNALKKYRTSKKILTLLYKDGELSGPSISKRIGISLPTALVFLNELVEMKLVEERGTGESRGGRKPALFGLSDASIFVVSCELGRYQGKLAIYNSQNQAVTPITTFQTNIDDDELIEKIFINTQELVSKSGINNDKIFGVGLAMPGLVNEKRGINNTIKKEAFRNVKERLEQKFNKLIYVNNDARMQAYGEYIFGAAKGFNNAVVINWSWGIGMGMILDGKLYDGAGGFSGELSHIKFIENGDLCICGKRGCLETVASVNVLLNNARQGIKEGKISQLTQKFEGRTNELEPAHIIEAAKAGDEFSISLLNKLGLALGKGLAMVIQLLNPDVIVLGGIVSGANQFVLLPIQQSLNKYCLEQISTKTKIVISENWEQSGLLGVTALLYQKLLSDKVS